MKQRSRRQRFTLGLLISTSTLVACSGGQTKAKPGGHIDPLPEVKPYETFTYAASNLRSPFQPQGPTANQANLRPSSRRNREFLENFSLDTLKMVGTFKVGPAFYGLVQSKDGLVHKVQPGNYIGTNDGKITEITGGKISITEIVPDGLGGYIERPASLALAN
jgi:type IV pilus assembly protein PilP